MSVTILTAYDERPDGPGEFVYRAGGTDLQERLRTTGATPHVLDLTGVPGFAAIARTEAGHDDRRRHDRRATWRATWPPTTRRSR